MLSNYNKVALRHLWQNKMLTFINVAGLSVAITCVLLAVLFIKNENSYDSFHSKKENLYRILTHRNDQKGLRGTVAGTGQPQGPAFAAAVPEIDKYARVLGGDINGIVLANDKRMKLQMLFVDETFFEIFTFPLIKGDSATALKEINSVVVTESTARKFFNSIDVVGKEIMLDADPSAERLGKPLIISGVVKDLPNTSSIRFDVLFPLKFMQLSFQDENWLNQYLGTFLLLKPGTDKGKVIDKFNQVYAFHAKSQVDENKKLYHFDPKVSYGLQNVTDMHLHPFPTGPWREGGIVNESNPVFSYLFGGIAVFILIMAGINFINISIAGSLKRAKEVGVRKITGGSRWQIIFQFLYESAIVCAFSFLVSIYFTHLSLTVFNQLIGKELILKELIDTKLILVFLLIFICIVLLAGLYPALALSAFKAREVLYNKQRLTGRNFLGRFLIVFQFAMAVFLIIASLVYYQQMSYIRTKDLGYNPYNVIRTYIPGDRQLAEIKEKLRYELSTEPAIKYISFGATSSNYEVTVGDKIFEAEHETIDENRVPVMELKLKAGRNLSSAFPADKSHSVLVNEAFVKAAGLKAPLGTTVKTSDYYDKELKTIVGVVEDFHFGSLHHAVKPMVMLVSDWNSGGIWIKFDKAGQQKAITALEAAFKKILPTAVLEYEFLDEVNAKEYLQEQRWQKIITIATAISFVICCLGLFGLASLAAQRKIKEIGIRKVLGASVVGISSLLTKEFLKLVAVAVIVASPFAWWAMQNWLQQFAYRIDISPWLFVFAAFISMLIAILTICYQAITAALRNPVESLRSE